MMISNIQSFNVCTFYLVNNFSNKSLQILLMVRDSNDT